MNGGILRRITQSAPFTGIDPSLRMAECLVLPAGRQLDPTQHAAFGDFAMRYTGASDPSALQPAIIATATHRMVSDERFAEIVSFSTLSSLVVRGIIEQQHEAAREQAEDWVRIGEDLDPIRLLPAVGYAIMVTAHRGQERRAGGPYARHPERVASRGYIALMKLRDANPGIDQDLIDSALFDWRTHDTPEDQRRRYLTPLSAAAIHDHPSIANPHGKTAGRALDMVTRIDSLWTPKGLNAAELVKSPPARVIKGPDPPDNQGERSPVRTLAEWQHRRQTKRGYRNILQAILEEAASDPAAPAWELDFHRLVQASRVYRARSTTMRDWVAQTNSSTFGRAVSVEEIDQWLLERHPDHGMPQNLGAKAVA
jgi:hypothetical protein